MSAVNTPTLTLADNGDNTGAVATVAGSTSGSTNTIYAAQWVGGFVPQAYTSYGSRTGDGAVSLALGLGYWFVYCKSTKAALDGAVSLVGGVRVTDGDDSIFEQCQDAVIAKIQALGLPSPFASSAVFKTKLPWTRGYIVDAVTAGVWVSPLGDAIKPASNQADNWELGLQVTAAQITNLSQTTGLTAGLLLRQQITDCLLPKAGEAALVGVDSVMNVMVDQGPVLDPAQFAQNFDAGAIVARCIVRRTRGLT